MADVLSEASELSGGEESQEEDVLTPAELIARLEEVRSRERPGAASQTARSSFPEEYATIVLPWLPQCHSGLVHLHSLVLQCAVIGHGHNPLLMLHTFWIVSSYLCIFIILSIRKISALKGHVYIDNVFPIKGFYYYLFVLFFVFIISSHWLCVFRAGLMRSSLLSSWRTDLSW